jgi:coenzyme F420 hydrogenase subunit beta
MIGGNRVGTFNSLSDIVSNGYCIGCGLCAAVAPEARIEMRKAAHGHLRPHPTAPFGQDEEARILSICPGINVTGPEAQGTDFDAVWGTARLVARGHATDPDLRFRASSGGIMTAVNRQLLESGEIAFVLQGAPDPDDPFGSVAQIYREPDDLMRAGGSRYGSAATLRSIIDILDLGEPFAVSMKPCDIAGLRNLQREDARARDLIRFTQAMFCGTVPSLAAIRGFFARRGHDLDREDPAEFRWRGNGCPGPTVATMKDGRVLQGTYNELWNENTWTTQFRCKVCPDAVGLQADLAVGDDWPGATPEGEDEGWNALIAHTEGGERIVRACAEAGTIAIHDVDVRYLDEVQPHHVRLRRGLLSRLEGCRDAGLPDPNFTRLALEDCAAPLSAKERVQIREGTRRRLKRGHGDDDAVADFGTAMGEMMRME